MMPVLIPYKKTQDRGMELKHVLRSLTNLKEWDGRVYISGDKEDWFKNIIHIPRSRTHGNPHRDVEFKILAALQSDFFPDEFILMNDDIYCMEPTEIKPLYRGILVGSTTNYYQRSKKRTAEYLRDKGIAEPMDYEVHAPMIMNRERRLEISHLLQSSFNGTPLQARSVYGNLFNVGGEVYEDKKTKTRELKKGIYISTQFYTDELQKLFPKKSNYEV